MTLEELKEYIIENVSEEDLISYLDADISILVEVLHDEIDSKFDRLISILGVGHE
jgi:hypothetical protein